MVQYQIHTWILSHSRMILKILFPILKNVILQHFFCHGFPFVSYRDLKNFHADLRGHPVTHHITLFQWIFPPMLKILNINIGSVGVFWHVLGYTSYDVIIFCVVAGICLKLRWSSSIRIYFWNMPPGWCYVPRSSPISKVLETPSYNIHEICVFCDAGFTCTSLAQCL